MLIDVFQRVTVDDDKNLAEIPRHGINVYNWQPKKSSKLFYDLTDNVLISKLDVLIWLSQADYNNAFK